MFDIQRQLPLIAINDINILPHLEGTAKEHYTGGGGGVGFASVRLVYFMQKLNMISEPYHNYEVRCRLLV